MNGLEWIVIEFCHYIRLQKLSNVGPTDRPYRGGLL